MNYELRVADLEREINRLTVLLNREIAAKAKAQAVAQRLKRKLEKINELNNKRDNLV